MRIYTADAQLYTFYRHNEHVHEVWKASCIIVALASQLFFPSIALKRNAGEQKPATGPCYDCCWKQYCRIRGRGYVQAPAGPLMLSLQYLLHHVIDGYLDLDTVQLLDGDFQLISRIRKLSDTTKDKLVFTVSSETIVPCAGKVVLAVSTPTQVLRYILIFTTTFLASANSQTQPKTS